MSIVEITTFRLAEGVTDDAFLALDKRIQTELVPNQPGFLRRTTARHGDDWLVVTLWATDADAAAFQRGGRRTPVAGRVRAARSRRAPLHLTAVRRRSTDVELGRPQGHPLRGARPRRHHHAAPARAAQRVDGAHARRVPRAAGPGGDRPGGAGHRRHRIGPGLLRRRRHPGARGPRRARRLRPRARRRRRHARLRRPPRVRRRLRLPLRHPQADHRRRQRAGGRGRPRARLLLRPAFRRPRAPSSPRRTGGWACRPSTACRGCCRASSA